MNLIYQPVGLAERTEGRSIYEVTPKRWWADTKLFREQHIFAVDETSNRPPRRLIRRSRCAHRASVLADRRRQPRSPYERIPDLLEKGSSTIYDEKRGHAIIRPASVSIFPAKLSLPVTSVLISSDTINRHKQFLMIINDDLGTVIDR